MRGRITEGCSVIEGEVGYSGSSSPSTSLSSLILLPLLHSLSPSLGSFILFLLPSVPLSPLSFPWFLCPLSPFIRSHFLPSLRSIPFPSLYSFFFLPFTFPPSAPCFSFSKSSYGFLPTPLPAPSRSRLQSSSQLDPFLFKLHVAFFATSSLRLLSKCPISIICPDSSRNQDRALIQPPHILFPAFPLHVLGFLFFVCVDKEMDEHNWMLPYLTTR